MTWAKGIAAAVLIALALFGGWQMSGAVGNLYDDWVFVRAARIDMIRRQMAAAQAKPKPATPPAQPAPVSPQ